MNIKICEWCGEPFAVKEGLQKSKWPKTCSQKCKGERQTWINNCKRKIRASEEAEKKTEEKLEVKVEIKPKPKKKNKKQKTMADMSIDEIAKIAKDKRTTYSKVLEEEQRKTVKVVRKW